VTADVELLLIFGALHLVALAFGGVLFLMLLRSQTTDPWRPPPDDEDDGGGGGNDRRRQPDPRSPGGLDLPADAAPARVRLREPGRIADGYPHPRRPDHTPRPRPRVPSR
jgi:hypothetical protein